MKNPQNVMIVLLLVTAAILTAMLVSVQTERAYAEPCVKGGGFVVASGRISTDMDLLYVIDVGARKLNYYGYSLTTKQVELGRQPIDLARLFGE